MPVHASHLPSFMSVYGEESKPSGAMPECPNRNASAPSHHTLRRPATSSAVLYNPSTAFAGFHRHRGSTSTSTSGSTEPSPTTTISTVDGSSLTELSPGPSPASPATKAFPLSFSADLRPRTVAATRSKGDFFELQRPTTPAKKPRNLKNLAVNTSSSLGLAHGAKTAVLPLQNPPLSSSAPPSPSFVKPPTPPRRRPGNLTLTLHTSANGPLPALSIPPTPSLKRPTALRHFQSSPSLPLCSPAISRIGGMELPPLRAKPPPHGFAEIPMEIEEEQEPNFDVPQSREEKPQAYPNGPICIYESGVDLFYEPTAEIAARYDVVLNVASEVANPFGTEWQEAKKGTDVSAPVSPTSSSPSEATRPFIRISANGRVDQAITRNRSVEAQHRSPTTPKASYPFQRQFEQEPSAKIPSSKPEYIHVPWEHNTDIVPDLYTLVRLIDDRVRQGKRILVHCQCGVSRSASLIVAYGLYKNPGISVQEAYDAVKQRSRWIGPNMNLIMQLQEFRNGLLRANGHSQGYKAGVPRRLSPHLAGTMPKNHSHPAALSPSARTPATAPLPPGYACDTVPQRASTGNMMPISPGPISAPTDFGWPRSSFRRTWDASHSPIGSPIEQPFVDTKGHVIPIVTIQHTARSVPGPERVKTRSDSDATLRQLPDLARQLSIEQDIGNHTAVATRNVAAACPQTCSDGPSLPTQCGSTSKAAAISTAPHVPKPSLQERRQNKVAPRATPLASNTAGFGEEKSSYTKPPSMEDTLPSACVRKAHLPSDTLPTLSRPNDSVISMHDQHSQGRAFIHGRKSVKYTDSSAFPISEEFHMAPIMTNDDADEDFGLLSPTRFEFPKNPFDGLQPESQNQANDARPRVGTGLSPRVHAISPPAAQANTLEQSPFQEFGFLGLGSSPRPTTPPQASKTSRLPPEEPSPMARTEDAHTDCTERKCRSFLDDDSHILTTGPEPPCKYANPPLFPQRRLDAFQTELEARPSDKTSTLMSPRLHEFTQNPFHPRFEPTLRSSSSYCDDRPYGSTQEVSGDTFDAERYSLFAPTDSDPRSPPQTGLTPITRNIWDVL